jgi:glycosyltransferase involved in cell wall biosynthesis
MRVCIAIPVFNEEKRLRNAVVKLHPFLTRRLQVDWEIVIADNGSNDRTLAIAESLSQEFPGVRVVYLNENGRGGALKRIWSESDADILSYMDVDLSSDLESFPSLIEALTTGGYDVAVGSRLLNPGLTTRCFKREFVSRCYNLLVRSILGTHFSDAQCGFKALTRRAAQHLLPLVEGMGWFFDTELLVMAEKSGYRIFDLPVRWVENCDSRVKIFRTSIVDLKELLRLRRKLRRSKT